MGKRQGHDLSSSGLVLRTLLAMAITLVMIGAAGIIFAERHLKNIQVDAYGSFQKNDIASLEAGDRIGSQDVSVIQHARHDLEHVAERSVVSKAQLIGPGGVVVASQDRQFEGTVNEDPDVKRAIEDGQVTAERTTDPGNGDEIYKYVSPVTVGGKPYVFYTTYNSSFVDERVSDTRLALLLTGLLTLVIGGLMFYLVAGRALIRDHRFALVRASQDGLTGLPNQRAFAIDLVRRVAAAERSGESLSLAIFDIDDFRRINDLRGREAGDAQLLDVASILGSQSVSNTLYRTGEDDFALIISRVNSEATSLVVEEISEELGRQGIRMSVGSSSMRPGVRDEVLRAEATAALAEARRRGGGRSVNFDEIRGLVKINRPDRLEAVRHMISEGGLETAFQPIWDFQKREVVAYEALTRPDARYGLSGPAEAFDIAEQIGQVHRLDEICVAKAFRDSTAIPPELLLFVNLTPQTLGIDASNDPWLRKAAAASGRELGQIVVEVTERFGGRRVSVMKRLEQLRSEGFRFALDDVGTGNSGLEVLASINADFMKMDRSIIASARTDPSVRALLSAMAVFASRTDTFVIAEGIEDQNVFDYIEDLTVPGMGIGRVVQGGQGFALGRPSSEIPPDPVWPLA